VDHAIAGDKRSIFDLHIASQQSSTRYDGLMPDLAVMRHVGVVHEKIVIANDRSAAFGGSTMDLAVLTDDIAMADLEETLPAFISDVLRDVADDRAHVDLIVLTDFCATSEHGMGQNSGAATDLHGTINHDVGTDVGFGMDIGTWVNQRSWVDRHEVLGA